MNINNNKPARFIEENGMVYTFIGELVTEEGVSPKVISSKRIQHEINDSSLKLIEFVKTPRTESTIQEFLESNSLNNYLLDELVGEGMILQVNPKNVFTALDRFNCVKIIPLSVSGNPDPEHTSLIEVKRNEDGPVIAFVPEELARLLWGEEKNFHIYKAVNKIAKHTGEDRKLIARRVLTNIPALLHLGLARLEWEDDSETNIFYKISKFFESKG